MKRFVIGLLIGLSVPAAMAAININIENIYLRDIAAIAFCTAQVSKDGWTKNIEANSYAMADKLLAARSTKR